MGVSDLYDYRVDVSNRITGVRDTGFYSSKKWIRIRDEIRIRDKNTCQVCGQPVVDRYIVDHVNPVTMENMLDWNVAYNPDNLQLLCLTCHNIKTFRKTKIAESRW